MGKAREMEFCGLVYGFWVSGVAGNARRERVKGRGDVLSESHAQRTCLGKEIPERVFFISLN